MLVDTARVSAAWQPTVPHVSGATRRSPGLTNFTYSADSFSQFVKVRSESAERCLNEASRGCTCAFSFAELYSEELAVVSDGTEIDALPPWQSVQPRCTVLVGCIVGSSVEVWQEMHPADLRSASSCDWPRNEAESCETFEGEFELVRIARKKDNAETHSTPSVRREVETGWGSLVISGAS
jgi:hypothetical protein